MSITEIEVIKNLIQSQAIGASFYVNTSKDRKNALNEFIESERYKEK